MASGEERFSEVTGDDFVRGADGGEVHARIPAKQKIDVCRYLIELQGSQRDIEEGVEECGDAGHFHEGVIVEDWSSLVGSPGAKILKRRGCREERLGGDCGQTQVSVQRADANLGHRAEKNS